MTTGTAILLETGHESLIKSYQSRIGGKFTTKAMILVDPSHPEKSTKVTICLCVNEAIPKKKTGRKKTP